MPELDLTITISVILGIAAIISPVLTAIINNHHQLKMKKSEEAKVLYERSVLYKREIIENYLRFAGKCIACGSESAVPEYREYYYLALLYVPGELKCEMENANYHIECCDFEKANEAFELLITPLKNMLSKQ